MIEATIDLAVFGMAAFGLVASILLFLPSNGTKPFVCGYMASSALLAVTAIYGMFVEERLPILGFRFAFGAILSVTTLWAMWKRH